VGPCAKEIDTLLVSIARAARIGDYGDAARDLNRFTLLCEQLRPAGETGCGSTPFGKFNYSLETVFMMLRNHDWVAVADLIEYELAPICRQLAKRLDGNPGAVPDNSSSTSS
jgi:hypothetical protein